MLELVALLVSLGAFLISCAALYLTTLKPAEIDIDHFDTKLISGTFIGPSPGSHDMELAVLISNTGARGGLLHELWVADLEWLGAGEAFWRTVERVELLPTKIKLPLPLEAGDVESALVVVTLLPAGVGPEEQAVRIAAMTEITVTIYWAFFRLGGLLPARWRFVPVRVRRKRERVERSLRLQIDASTYRSQTILHWHSHTNYEHLVRLAEQARA